MGPSRSALSREASARQRKSSAGLTWHLCMADAIMHLQAHRDRCFQAWHKRCTQRPEFSGPGTDQETVAHSSVSASHAPPLPRAALREVQQIPHHPPREPPKDRSAAHKRPASPMRPVHNKPQPSGSMQQRGGSPHRPAAAAQQPAGRRKLQQAEAGSEEYWESVRHEGLVSKAKQASAARLEQLQARRRGAKGRADKGRTLPADRDGAEPGKKAEQACGEPGLQDSGTQCDTSGGLRLCCSLL